MDAERARALLLCLPYVVETMQWGNNLVFWVGDKAIGGKMFALVNLDADGKAVISYAAGAERYAELMEQEGLAPAPYFARIFWVAAEGWGAHRDADWERELRAAHALTLEKLSAPTRRALDMPAAEVKKMVKERRAAAAEKGIKAR